MKLVAYENGSFSIEQSHYPIRKQGEVIIKIKACGICGSDVPRVLHGKAYYYPIVIGHEFSGIVVESDKDKLTGKRVGVFPVLPCMKCEFCQKGLYANCVNYDYYGSRRNGGMQEFLSVKEENLIELPDNVSYEAGAMLEPTAVCLHAVKKAGIQKGESVLIYGAGTIGLLSAMWAKDFGAKDVYFVDINEQKLETAKKMGFKRYNGEKVHVAIEACGVATCINDAIEKIQPFGRLILIGNAGDDVTVKKETYAKILRKQLRISGSWNSDFSKAANDWKDSVYAISEKRIDPEMLITHKFTLKDSDKAFQTIKNKESYVKIMVVE